MKSKRGGGTTLSDVAKLADVSDITVSRVLRNSGPISAVTRARVLDAVQRTGYVHNRVAGSLASSRSSLVGVILPSLSNNVFPEVMSGINEALAQSGFQPVVGVTDYDPAVEEALVQAMLAWKPAAMILAGLSHTRSTSRMLEASGIRVIEIMEIGQRPIDVAIGFSHHHAGLATARHLVERGYRNFGYVGHDLSRDDRAAQRLKGLTAGLATADQPPPQVRQMPGPSSILSGREGLQLLRNEYPACDVVVFSNDDMAVGGIFDCLAAGLTPKTDLGIFGFNGLDIGQALPTPLSTIRSNRQQIGQIAVQTFLSTPSRPEAVQSIDTGFEFIPGATA